MEGLDYIPFYFDSESYEVTWPRTDLSNTMLGRWLLVYTIYLQIKTKEEENYLTGQYRTNLHFIMASF